MADVTNLRATQNRETSPQIDFTWSGGSRYHYRIDGGSFSNWRETSFSNVSIVPNWGVEIFIEVDDGPDTEAVGLTVKVPPVAPTGLTLIPIVPEGGGAITQATLAWDDPNNSDITGYEVIITENWYDADNDDSVQEPDAITSVDTGFSHIVTASTKNEGTYRIYVRGKNSIGKGQKVELDNGSPKGFVVHRHPDGIKLIMNKLPNETCTHKYLTNENGSEYVEFTPTIDGDKMYHVLETEDNTTTKTFRVKCFSIFTGNGNTSFVSPTTDRDSADDALDIFLAALDIKQKAYFEKHGRYFQKLNSTLPNNNAVLALDHADPSDQGNTDDSNHGFVNKLPFSVKIDEYLADGESAYLVKIKLNDGLKTAEKTSKKMVTMGASGNTFNDFEHSEWNSVSPPSTIPVIPPTLN